MSDFGDVNVVKSEFDAGGFVTNAKDILDGMTVTGVDTLTTGTYDIIGMNAVQIPEMREAIAIYVADATDWLEKIAEECNGALAFKNQQVEDAIKAYLEAVREVIVSFVSNLLAFSDKLADVHNAWLESAERYAEDVIGAGTSGMANAGISRYDENIEVGSGASGPGNPGPRDGDIGDATPIGDTSGGEQSPSENDTTDAPPESAVTPGETDLGVPMGPGPLSPEQLVDLTRRAIRGDFGNGEDRRQALGIHYDEIQNLVNINIRNGNTQWDNIGLGG